VFLATHTRNVKSRRVRLLEFREYTRIQLDQGNKISFCTYSFEGIHDEVGIGVLTGELAKVK